MRGLVLFLAIFYVSGVVPDPVQIQPAGLFEDIINATIQGFLQNVSDPVTVDDASIDLDEPDSILQGTINLNGLEVSGLKGVEVPYLLVEILSFQLDFNIFVPYVNVSTGYLLNVTLDSDATEGPVNIYGDGSLSVNLENLNITGSGKADFSNGVAVKGLDIHVKLGAAIFDVEGLFNDPELSANVTTLLNDGAVDFINDNDAVVSPIISTIVQAIFDAIQG